MMEEKITLVSGKYAVTYNQNSGKFGARRYGEEWRDLVGDKLIFAMFVSLVEAHKIISAIANIEGDISTDVYRAVAEWLEDNK